MRILIIIILLVPILSIAQIKNINYLFCRKIQNERIYRENYLLKIDDTSTLFYSKNFQKQIFESSNNSSLIAGEIWNQEIVFNDNKKIVVHNFLFMKHYFYYDTLNIVQWQIQHDTSTILGMKCNSAKANFRGYNWTVWFTTSIPCKFGPWLLNGLPGLILKASVENDMSFEAVSFNDKDEFVPKMQELKKIAIKTCLLYTSDAADE